MILYISNNRDMEGHTVARHVKEVKIPICSRHCGDEEIPATNYFCGKCHDQLMAARLQTNVDLMEALSIACSNIKHPTKDPAQIKNAILAMVKDGVEYVL